MNAHEDLRTINKTLILIQSHMWLNLESVGEHLKLLPKSSCLSVSCLPNSPMSPWDVWDGPLAPRQLDLRASHPSLLKNTACLTEEWSLWPRRPRSNHTCATDQL